jgi:hypothetical protein
MANRRPARRHRAAGGDTVLSGTLEALAMAVLLQTRSAKTADKGRRLRNLTSSKFQPRAHKKHRYPFSRFRLKELYFCLNRL